MAQPRSRERDGYKIHPESHIYETRKYNVKFVDEEHCHCVCSKRGTVVNECISRAGGSAARPRSIELYTTASARECMRSGTHCGQIERRKNGDGRVFFPLFVAYINTRRSQQPINFGMMYIEEPDFHGHGIGINGARFDEVLLKLDEITYYLHEKLRENNMTDVNVIHLSDHGMATVTIDRIVNLTNYIDPKDYTTSGLSPVIHIYPRPGMKHGIARKKVKFTRTYKKRRTTRINLTSISKRISPSTSTSKTIRESARFWPSRESEIPSRRSTTASLGTRKNSTSRSTTSPNSEFTATTTLKKRCGPSSSASVRLFCRNARCRLSTTSICCRCFAKFWKSNASRENAPKDIMPSI
ncbi:unnamed protein product, partial [Trichogramma brassicae]